MKDSHRILPVFLPRWGCTSRCAFCNQEEVTGIKEVVSPEHIEEMLGGESYDEIAFYGGSFLSIPEPHRSAYLGIVNKLIDTGRIKRLRLSTRPDSINAATISALAPFCPATVELGVESLSGRILAAANRGHTGADAFTALAMLHEAGHTVIWQLMIGLPEEFEEDLELTLAGIKTVHPDAVRLSPTLVLAGTTLEEIWRHGDYQPLELERAVEILARWVEELEGAGIPVIRLGLHPAEGKFTPGEVLAGPWHPALGALVRSRIALGEMERLLDGYGGDSPVIAVPRDKLSLYLGHRKSNLLKLREKYPGITIIPDEVAEPRL